MKFDLDWRSTWAANRLQQVPTQSSRNGVQGIRSRSDAPAARVVVAVASAKDFISDVIDVDTVPAAVVRCTFQHTLQYQRFRV